MGLGCLISVYEDNPVVKEGGILLLANLCIDQRDLFHHPAYIEFWNKSFKRTRDADELYDQFADDYTNRPFLFPQFKSKGLKIKIIFRVSWQKSAIKLCNTI